MGDCGHPSLSALCWAGWELTWKVKIPIVPDGWAGSKDSSPPIRSIKACVIASPRPVPGADATLGSRDLLNG